MAKAKACPNCGETETGQSPIFQGRQLIGRYEEVCSGCALPVALWKQWKAAMELADLILDTSNSGVHERLARIALGRRKG